MSSNPFSLVNIQRQQEQQDQQVNPFSLRAIQQDRGIELRNTLTDAVRYNPDQFAEAEQLSKRYPTPAEVLYRNLADVKMQAAVDAADERLRTSPRLAQAMREKPELARLAHDDVPALSEVSKAVERTFAGTLGDVGVTALKGAAGLPQALVGLLNIPTFGYAGKGVEAAGVRFEETQKILDRLYSPAQQRANAAMREAEGFIGTLQAMLSNPSTIATTVGESAPQMLGGAALGRGMVALAPKLAPWLAAAFGEGLMGAGATAEAIRSQESDGLLTLKQSFASVMSGAGTAMFGIAGGKLAQKFKLTDIDTALVARGVDEASAATLRNGFISSITKAGIAEGVFEELPQSVQEQMWQNWATDRPLGENVGKSAAMGLLAGFSMGGGFSAAQGAALRMADILGRQEREQESAEISGQALNDALKAAGQSKLLERSPEQFRAVLDQLGGDAEVRFDARLLLEQASPEKLVEAMPSLAQQLADAQAAGAEVRVPVGEFIAGVVGTPLEQSLRDYARLGENELSLAEAKEAAGKAEQFLTQQAERVIQQAQDQVAMRAAHDEVKAGIQQQLDSVGRFSKQVNEAYATFSAAFYTTMAGRMGMTPQQMAARYPLRIVGQTGAGQVMDQDFESLVAKLKAMQPAVEAGQAAVKSEWQKRIERQRALEGMRAAMRDPETGKIYTGWSHQAAINSVPKGDTTGAWGRLSSEWDQSTDNAGFVDAQGNFISRAEAEKQFGVLTMEDIRDAKKTFRQDAIGVLAQTPTSTAQVTLDENGLPEISGDGVFIGFTQPADDGEVMMNQAIMSPDGTYQGYVEATYRDNRPVAIYDIYVDPESRGQGVGERAVKAMLDASGGTLQISNIVSDAQGFWEKVGVPVQNVEAGAAYDGTIDQQAFADSPAGQKRRRAQGDLGSDAGARAGQAGQGTLEQAAFHGSPHRFDAFTFDNIGGGEGAQAYGWGLYFAENKDIAEHYRKMLAPGAQIRNWRVGSIDLIRNGDYKDYSPRDNSKLAEARSTLAESLLIHEGDVTAVFESEGLEGVKRVIRQIAADQAEMREDLASSYRIILGGLDRPGGFVFDAVKDQGVLYSVEIPDEAVNRMLLWDEPLSKQPAAVKKALKKIKLPATASWDKSGSDYEYNIRGVRYGQVVQEGDKWVAKVDGPGEVGRFKYMSEAMKAVQAQTAHPATLAKAAAPSSMTGKALYKALEADLGSDKAASEYLNSLGIPGLRYWDGGSRTEGQGTRNVVVWDQKTLDAMNAQVQRLLEQAGQQRTPLGTFNPATLELALNPNANLSTFLHESGHFFLEVMSDLASQPNAPAGIVEDMNKILAWFGIKGDEAVGGADSGVPLGQGPSDEVSDALDSLTGNDLEDDQVFSRPLPEASDDSLDYVGKFGGMHVSVRGGVREAGPHEFFFYDNDDNPLGFARLTKNAKQASISMIAFTEDARGNGYGKAFYKYLLDTLGVEVKSDKEITEGTAAMYRSLANDYPARVDSDGRVVLSPKTLAQGDQPTTPAQPVQPKRTPLETWQSMTLDQKRPYHERFAESIEQYLMEGKAPSVELQPVFQRFRSWLLRVYKSVRDFLAGRGVLTGEGVALEQAAFHGTPHRGIEKFSTEFIGTGEGNQAYGWGLYFASKREIAEHYRKVLSSGYAPTLVKDGVELNSAADIARAYYQVGRVYNGYGGRDVVLGFTQDGPYRWSVRVQEVGADGQPKPGTRPRSHSTMPELKDLERVLLAEGYEVRRGQLYEVEIPEDSEMLLWDRPLSEQPTKVKDALKGTDYEVGPSEREIERLADEMIDADAADWADENDADPVDFSNNADRDAYIERAREELGGIDSSKTGRDLYRMIMRDAGYRPQLADNEDYQRDASMTLLEFGIKGIKYLDGTSRGAGDGSYNYVIFSGDDVQIRNQFYQGQPPAGLNIQLNDEIRGVFDRMLASEEQIAQAEEVAGMLPDEKATQDAIDKLTARSLRDMKWLANARSKAIKALQKQAAALRKEVEVEVTAEVAAMPEFAADAELKRIRKANKAAPTDIEMAVVADAFGFPDVDTMLKAIDAVGKRADVIEGLTDQRMLERHGDLVDQRAIEEAANAAIHNDARARVLATELKAQAELLGARTDTGETNSAGNAITVNTLKRAAELFAANVVDRTQLRHLKRAAWDHTSAERRAAKAWQDATAAGKTQEAVQAKQDQFLNNAAAKAALEAQQEVVKIRNFFARVVKGNNEKTVERGRDPDLVNAARAILTAYGVQSPASKGALEYLEVVKRNDPEAFAAVEQGVAAALANPRPLDTLTIGELRALRDEIDTIWTMAKRSRQMEVDGDLMDIEDAEAELRTRLEDVPNVIPGELSAMTPTEQAQRGLQFAVAIGRRVEAWAEALDGKWGGPFTRLVFGPIKTAADKFRAARIDYRKRFQALVDNLAPAMRPGLIEAPELGYTFGKGHNGMGVSELLHAILHTGNDSNKRKLLLGRGWAAENPDGTLDTARWDAFLKRMTDTGVLTKAHYDFAQGVWDLLEDTKTLAQRAHRDVFGRYFDEVTAQPFDTPFGSYRGGYVPAQADTRIVTDAALRQLADMENQNMAFSFPTTAKGFTKSRTEYNRPLVLDLRTIPQHIDKVLMFSYLEPAVRDVNRLVRRKGISQPLSRIQPAAYEGMLVPWLNRSARQQVETPIVGDGRVSRVLSTIRQRAGMALMFGNISNTLQQITGLSGAMVKVGPGNMMGALATYLSSPKKTAQQVAESSAYMRDRMQNEIAAMNDAMNDILLNPTVYESAQAWTQKHAYFLQSAFDNVLSPIVWTGAYNQALKDGMTEVEAVKFADSTVRQTQGSTLPEDVSRIETGPAYARVFTQFISYFNMMANTNGTALLNIAKEVGLKKGAGKALTVVTMGLLVPLWVAEAIAIAFRGGPEDEDRDGEYLDDWVASVLGIGTIKGMFAMIPFVGQAANVAINKLNDNPADDRASLSPAVSLLEAGVGAPISVYKAIADDGSKQKAVRDVASLVSIATGLPATFVARPVGYLSGVAEDRIDPTSELDFARGVVTGTASPESKN